MNHLNTASPKPEIRMYMVLETMYSPVLRSDTDKIAFNVFCLDSHSYLYCYQQDLEEKVLLKRFLYSGR